MSSKEILENTVNQAISDFDGIKAAIQSKGVTVEDGTDTSEYGNLIRSIVDAGEIVTSDGTVVSKNADFAEVAEWADGNPDSENRIGYFVCNDVNSNGITMKIATSGDDVRGVTMETPAFVGNYSTDKVDENGNLLPQYAYVGFAGIVPVIDNGSCTVGGRCMPDDNGCAIPSTNNMGYQILSRVDENHVLIVVEPTADMIQRIKTDVTEIETALDNKVDKAKLERLEYYGDSTIVPSDKSYFTVNTTGETITGLTDTGKTQTELVIPYEINGTKITNLYSGSSGTSILNGNSVITKVVLPNSITNIGGFAFYRCTLLKSINIPNSVTTIANYAFVSSISLKLINIPNSVTAIASGAFSGCTSLISVNIPNSVTYIDDTAFNDCSENLTIYCEQGSYADNYVKAKNIDVIYTEIDPSKYLSTTNTTEYTPTADYNPATKKYVDDGIRTYINEAILGGAW